MNLLTSILAILSSVLLTNALLTPLSVRTWGQRSYRYGEVRLKNTILHQDISLIPFGSVSEEFTYPAKNETNYRNITMISVTDQLNDKKNRVIVVRKGGVGYTFVTMQVTAPRKSGYSMLVDIFG